MADFDELVGPLDQEFGSPYAGMSYYELAGELMGIALRLEELGELERPLTPEGEDLHVQFEQVSQASRIRYERDMEELKE